MPRNGHLTFPIIPYTLQIAISRFFFFCGAAWFSYVLLPSAQVGVAYSQTITASGRTSPYHNFSVTAGSLPAGLTLSSSGVLSGTPTAGGSFSFTVSATDSSTGAGPYAAGRLSLTVTTATILLSPTSLRQRLQARRITRRSRPQEQSGQGFFFFYCVTFLLKLNFHVLLTEQFAHFKDIVGTFPDPLGIGQEASLVLVVFAEVLGSLLLAVGLFTRVAAAVLVVDMFVAFLMVHKTALTGRRAANWPSSISPATSFSALRAADCSRWTRWRFQTPPAAASRSRIKSKSPPSLAAGIFLRKEPTCRSSISHLTI